MRPGIAISALALAAALPGAAHAHDEHAPVLLAQAGADSDAQTAPEPDAGAAIQSADLGHGLYMLTGEGGNMMLSVGERATVLVDDQYDRMVPAIEAKAAELGSRPVDYIINTHWHGDHTGGNEALGGAGATIVAHENVRRRMATEQDMAPLGGIVPASPETALPVITFDDDLAVHLNEETIELIHIPNAHTDGDIIVHVADADVIHAGDIFFNGAYPVIDIAAEGSLEGMIAALTEILAMAGPETKIIPGHGPLAGRADVETARDLLVEVRNLIAPMVEDGMTLQAVIDAAPLAHLDAEYGQGFMGGELFTRIVYADLVREQEDEPVEPGLSPD